MLFEIFLNTKRKISKSFFNVYVIIYVKVDFGFSTFFVPSKINFLFFLFKRIMLKDVKLVVLTFVTIILLKVREISTSYNESFCLESKMKCECDIWHWFHNLSGFMCKSHSGTLNLETR